MEHPTAVVLAMFDGVNNLPVAVQSVDNDACSGTERPNCDEVSTVKQDAQGHSGWTRVLVVTKYSRYIH